MDTWQHVLNEGDRGYLAQFLPDVPDVPSALQWDHHLTTLD